ncbi:hypothetical protein FACS1894166_07800 [Bacilli bacterium]|nr:hypothetical protein FACS1894166_07800 [Bacilli bacterium]
MCGAYNMNVCKHLMSIIKPNDKVLVIGRKGFHILKNKGLEKSLIGPMEFSDVGLNYLELLPSSEHVLQMFEKKMISSANIVYTKFINSLSFEPRHMQVLPLQHNLFKPDDQKSNPERVDLTDDYKEIMYEPTKDEILKSSIPIYLTTSIFAAIAESKVCENASRRNAMETATDNADRIMDELTLEYNQARQENITQEINEIVAGADGSQ